MMVLLSPCGGDYGDTGDVVEDTVGSVVLTCGGDTHPLDNECVSSEMLRRHFEYQRRKALEKIATPSREPSDVVKAQETLLETADQQLEMAEDNLDEIIEQVKTQNETTVGTIEDHGN